MRLARAQRVPLSRLCGINAVPHSLAACQRAMMILDAAEAEQWEAANEARKGGGEYAETVTASLLLFLARRGG